MSASIDGSAIDKVLRDAVDSGGVPHVAAIAADRDGVIYVGAAGPREAGGPHGPRHACASVAREGCRRGRSPWRDCPEEQSGFSYSGSTSPGQALSSVLAAFGRGLRHPILGNCSFFYPPALALDQFDPDHAADRPDGG